MGCCYEIEAPHLFEQSAGQVVVTYTEIYGILHPLPQTVSPQGSFLYFFAQKTIETICNYLSVQILAQNRGKIVMDMSRGRLQGQTGYAVVLLEDDCVVMERTRSFCPYNFGSLVCQ